jgi:hypothetical protein
MPPNEREEQRRSAQRARRRRKAEGKRRPEHGMRHPHFRGEAEDERTEAGRRQTGVEEDDPAFCAIGDPGCAEPNQRRGKMQEAVDENTARRILRQRDKKFGRHIGVEITKQPPRNIVPVEIPGPLRRDGVGKDRAVAEHLQSERQPNCDEQKGRPDSGGDHKMTQEARLPHAHAPRLCDYSAALRGLAS